MTSPPSPPPGWYADPSGQPQWRWWDGRQWTPHVAPGVAPRLDPRPRVAAERSSTRWAAVGFFAQAIAAVLLPWELVRLFRIFQPLVTASVEELEAGPTPAMMRSMFQVIIEQQVLSVISLAALTAAGVWAYRAAVAAAALGIPARREPYWVVLAYFIPVINFWWPCQSLQDLLPPGHPTRRTILLAWVPFILGSFVMIGGVLPSMFTQSAGPLVVTAVGAMMTAAGWLSAIRLVPVVLAEHERLAAVG